MGTCRDVPILGRRDLSQHIPIALVVGAVEGEDRAAADGTLARVPPHHPDRREPDATTMARARRFVGDRARSERQDGEVRLARADGVARDALTITSLADVAAGASTGRAGDSDITVFLSGGPASEYGLAVTAVVERAQALGLGTRVAL